MGLNNEFIQCLLSEKWHGGYDLPGVNSDPELYVIFADLADLEVHNFTAANVAVLQDMKWRYFAEEVHDCLDRLPEALHACVFLLCNEGMEPPSTSLYSCAVLCCAGLGWAGLGWAGLCWAVMCCAVPKNIAAVLTAML